MIPRRCSSRAGPLPAAVLASSLALLAGCTTGTPQGGRTDILAHRGVHQPLSTEGMTRKSCTAERMSPGSGHAFIENTLPSIAEAVRLGATAVEIDVHPTTDGEFAVFHDWTLECRTDGQGVTRSKTMAELRRLDVGHGYTADGGRTFPLRGRGAGLMPTLGEVLAEFPTLRLHINMKGRNEAEADRLAAYLLDRPGSRPERLTVFAHEPVRRRLASRLPVLRTYSKITFQACARDYLMTGWLGMPDSCRKTVLVVPVRWRGLFWGWPHGVAARFEKADSELLLGGAVQWRVRSIGGLDDPRRLAAAPVGWRGGVMTDRIERIGPAVREREARANSASRESDARPFATTPEAVPAKLNAQSAGGRKDR
jgi:glycerophosphoryl diester phosphodiesterase